MSTINELKLGMLSFKNDKKTPHFQCRLEVAPGIIATLVGAECHSGYKTQLVCDNFTVSANPMTGMNECNLYLNGQLKIHEFKQLKLAFITNNKKYIIVTYENFNSTPKMVYGMISYVTSARPVLVYSPSKSTPKEDPAKKSAPKPTAKPNEKFVLSPDANIAYIRYDENSKMAVELRSQYPALFDGCYDSEKAMKFIMEKVFPDKTLGTYIVSNFQYYENDHPVRAITLRTKNSEYIYKMLKKKRQLCIKGTLRKTQNGGELVIRSIELVTSRNKQKNEGEYDLRIYHNSSEPKGNCLYDILANIISLPELTNQNLLLWREYLEWKRKLSELRIKGAKYCAVRFEENEQEKTYFLRFLLAFPNKKEAELFRRALRREKMSVFENGYSENRFQFKFNSKAQGAETGIELQCISADVKLHRSIPDFDWESMISSCAQYTNDRMSYIELIQNINEQFASEKCYMDVCFEVSSDTFTQNNISVEWGEDNYENIKQTVLEQIPADGFIATTHVGDFALNSRLMKAIDSLQREDHGTLSSWLFDITQARPVPKEKIDELYASIKWKNKNLNDSQKKAIVKMLLAPDVFLCQGPPGTGKTTVIAEAIYQWASRGYSILLASQTHLAVNNALEKLLSPIYADPCIRAIRLTNSRDIQRKIDESIESITEENVLESFYTMISNHLEESFLRKWNSDDDIIANAKADLAQIRQLLDGKAELTNTIADLDEQVKILEEALADVEQDYASAREQIENARKEAESIAALSSDLTLDKLLQSHQNDVVSGIVGKVIAESEAIENILQIGIPHLNKYSNSTEIGENLWGFITVLKNTFDFYSKYLSFIQNGFEDEKLESLRTKSKELLVKMATDASCAKMWRDSKKAITDYEVEREEELRRYIPTGTSLKPENKAELEALANIIISQTTQFIDACACAFTVGYSDSPSVEDDALVEMMTGLRKQIDDNSVVLESCRNRVCDLEAQIVSVARKYGSTADDICDIIERRYDDACHSVATDEERKVLEDLIRGSHSYIGEARSNMRSENANYLEDFVRSCNVVGVSCTENSRTLDNKGFKEFDVVIIDEVSKATPPELLMPMLRAKKVVLVGDHRQLPPLFNEHESSYEEAVHRAADSEDDEVKGILTMDNFNKYREMVTASLFKEYFNHAGESIKETLSVQYRMHSDIMRMVNLFYSDKLSSGVADIEDEIKKHGVILKSKSGKVDLVDAGHHAYWIDSSEYHSIPRYESVPMGSTSFENRLEAHTIIALLRKIDDAYAANGVNETVEVGVINFYYSQVRLLNELKRQDIKANGAYKVIKVEINTVDRFQGKEKPIVIVSLVRNNKHGKAGDSSHIAAYQRINVAVSRAQKLLFIVGAKNMYIDQRVNLDDMDTGEQLPQSPIYRQIIESFITNGCYLTADDILDEDYENK